MAEAARSNIRDARSTTTMPIDTCRSSVSMCCDKLPPLGLDGVTASTRLLQLGSIAATPMLHWGGLASAKYLRLVFSNEPVDRLRGVGKRVKLALT